MTTAVRSLERCGEPFRLKVRPERDRVRIVAAGEVDLVGAGELAAQLDEHRACGAEAVVLDLRETSFLDSSGVAVIVAAHRLADANGQSFELIAGPPAVQRVLGICGLLEQLRFRSDEG